MIDPLPDVEFVLGDITDFERLTEVAETHNIEAIIHLAALQVPFCKADPVGSTRINVMGSVHMLELARQRGITRMSYASSVAAPAIMGIREWGDAGGRVGLLALWNQFLFDVRCRCFLDLLHFPSR